MSRGCRIQPSSRLIVAAAKCAVPRIPLPFLYPCVQSQRLNSTQSVPYDREESSNAGFKPDDESHASNAEQKTPSDTFSIRKIPYPQRGYQVKEQVQSANRHGDLVTQRRNERGQQKERCAETVLSSWEGIDSEQFHLAPVQLRRVKTTSARLAAHRNDKSISNSQLKSKGTWSYDWRVSLLALRENTPTIGSSAPSGNDGTSSRPAHVQITGDVDVQNEHGEDATIWDKERFLASVKAATRTEVPRVLQRFLYGGQDPVEHFEAKRAHKFQVRDALMAMFNDPAAYPIQSEKACNTALRFLSGHVFFDDCRKIINTMSKVGISPTTTSFNILLEGAAKQHDLFNFTGLLMAMIRQDIKPDTDTWRNFILAIDSDAIKLKVVGVMKEMGLLKDVTTLQKVAVTVLDIYLRRHVKSGDQVTELIAQLDEEYETQAWLTTFAANKICKALGDDGQTHQIMDLLKIMRKRECKLNNGTLTSVLTHCKRARDPRLAAKFLTLFNQTNVLLRETDFGILFELGWSIRYYNVCMLVWSVACSSAAVPFAMQGLVYKSLIKNTPKYPKDDNERWMKQAGKVLVGRGFGYPGEPRYHELPDRLKIINDISQWLPDNGARHTGIQLAKQLLSENLTGSGRFYYAGDFLEDLDWALRLDEKWNTLGWRRTQLNQAINFNTVEWKIRGVIRPQFRRKLKENVDLYLPKPSFDGDELLPYSASQPEPDSRSQAQS